MPPQEAVVPAAAQRSGPGPWLFRAYVVMLGGRAFGMLLAPLLLAHAPWALLVLSPAIANLVLVAALVAHGTYWLLALPVSLVQCGLGYALGRAHKEDAVAWLIARRLVSAGRVARLRPLLRRAAPLLLVVFPGPIVATLAGASGCAPRLFWPVTLVAQGLWVGLCQASGVALLSWIVARRAQLARHLWPIMIGVALLALLGSVRRWRAPRQGGAAKPTPRAAGAQGGGDGPPG